MGTWLRSHGTTTAAVLIALGLTAVFGYIAVASWLGALYPDRLDPAVSDMFGGFTTRAFTGGTRISPARNASGIIAFTMGSVVLLCAIIVIGLAFLRAWAREAAFLIFGLLGTISLAASLAGLTADPPAPSAWSGILVGVLNLSVVALLLTRSARRAFKVSLY